MRKHLILLSMLLGLTLAQACATTPGSFDPKEQMRQTPDPVANLRKPMPTAGSLFTEARTEMYLDLRARNVGDIVTVEVVENSKATKKNDTEAERTNDYEAGIGSMLGYQDAIFPWGSTGEKDHGKMIGANFKSKHKAEAELTKEDTMTASIGCTVIEALPNGNMIIRGNREIQVNGETQHIILSGTVRPNDISAQNTVMSTQLADARIEYTGRGVLSDKQTPGWLGRLLDHIWPF